MSIPFLSIIIPVYNVEKYLEKCVESILNQSYKNYEIIFINDGSTDASGELCDKFAQNNDKIKVIHQSNKGLSAARNLGISTAKGHYIWFIDSDDWINEIALETIYNELLKDDNLEMLAFYEQRFYENTNEFEKSTALFSIDTTTGNDFIEKEKKFVSAACFYIYQTNFLKNNNLNFIKKMIHEDDFFNLSCFSKVKKIKKIPFIFYYYRIRSNSITTCEIKSNRLNAYIELIKFCNQLKHSDLSKKFLENRKYTYINLLFLLLNKYQIETKQPVSEYLSNVKKINPKQKIYFDNPKGIIFEKILYNLNVKWYFLYKKTKHKNSLKIK